MPVAASPKKDRFARAADAVADAEREIQKQIDRNEKAQPKGDKKSKDAMQAGAQPYPEPPFPKQHQVKPGMESDLRLTPMYDAPHYKGSEKLKGKVALITGADSGIGRAVAVLFAREGADVAIAYLNEHSDAEETKAAVENEGRRCIMISGDVADPDFCKEAVDRTTQQLGRLDVLVNNAAFQEHVNDFEDLTEAHFDRTIKTNLYGYFHMAKAAVRTANEARQCHRDDGIGHWSPWKQEPARLFDDERWYPGLRALACYPPDRQGIRVNAVAPGPVWTPLNPADRDADAVSHFGSETPMKRPAQPEEIAPAFVFLAAPTCSSYITGEILPIIGGYIGG